MDVLDQIAAEAAQLETEQAQVQQAIENPEEQQEPAIDPALAWAQIPKMFGGILSMALPELGAVYTDDKCHAWGSAMSMVADKYGWDAAETMAKWGPEIALTLATLPLAIPTVKAIQKAVDKKKKETPIDGDNLVKPADQKVQEEAASVQE